MHSGATAMHMNPAAAARVAELYSVIQRDCFLTYRLNSIGNASVHNTVQFNSKTHSSVMTTPNTSNAESSKTEPGLGDMAKDIIIL